MIEHCKKKNLLPAVVFTFSKKKINSIAGKIYQYDLTNSNEKSKIRRLISHALSTLRPGIKLSNSFSSWQWFAWTVMLSIMVICCHWRRKLLSCCFLKVWLKYCLLRKPLLWVLTCLQRLLFSTLLKRLQGQMVGWDSWTRQNTCRCQVVLGVVGWIKREQLLF